MKRVLSCILIVTLLVSISSIGAFADWSETDPKPIAKLSVEGVDGSNPNALIAGQKVRVTLTISGLNKYWSSYQSQLSFNSEAFELEKITEYGETKFDVNNNCRDLKTLFGTLTVNDKLPGELIITCATSALDSSNYGPMLIPEDTTYTYLRDIVAFTATFTAKENINAGEYQFSVPTLAEATLLDTDDTFYQLSFTVASGYSIVTTSTDDLRETVNVAKPNSIIITGDDTIAAPEAISGAAQQKTAQYSAVVIGESSIISNPTVAWTISGNDNNVTIDSSSGVVTVKSGAVAGDYKITATATVDRAELEGTKTIKVTKDDLVAESITISGSTDTITVPGNNEEDATADFTASVVDQYGETMTDAGVKWSVSPEVEGISIAGGVLTVTNAAKISIDTEGKTLTVTAACGDVNDTATVTVKRAVGERSSIEILKDGVAIESDNVAAGEKGNYTAQYYDQYGYPMEPDPGTTPTWEMSDYKGCKSDDFTLTPGSSGNERKVEVTVDGKVKNGASATLKVSENDLSDSITINVNAIEFTAEEGAITYYYKDSEDGAYYGLTWGELVQIDQSKITATYNGEKIEGTYYIKVSQDFGSTYDDVNLNDRPVCDPARYMCSIYFDSADRTFEDIYVAKHCTNGTSINVPDISFTLNPKPVTVTGITVKDKVYNGTVNVEATNIDTSNASLTDIVEGDEIYFDAAGATGTFSDENVGNGKTVTISGLTLSGEDAANYTLSTVTATGNITAKELTADVSGVSVTKEYDGTTAPGAVTDSATADTGIIGETVTVKVSAGEYADKNVGNDKSVTLTLSLSGDNASNYTLSNTTVEIYNAEITAKDVTKSEDFAQNVVVGVGTFTAPKFTGIGGEEVTGTVTYSYDGKTSYDEIVNALKSLSEGQTATINYTFTADGNYSGEITGTIIVTMVDIVFTVGTETATADNAVTIKEAPTYGDDWSEIVTIKENDIVASLNGETLTGGAYSLNVSGMPTASEQSYTVQYTYGDKTYNVCTGTVTVAQKELTITGLSVEDKEYDGNTDAIVTGTATLEGVLDGDQVAVVDGTASFVNKNVGTEKAVTFSGYSLNGQDAGNYKLSAQPSVTATINPKPVTITGVTAEDKTYDGKTTATIANLGTINGIISGETVTIKAGTGTFASADVGTGITVTFSGFSLTGTDSGNYTLSAQPADTTADIAKGTYTGTPNTVNVNILINQSAAQTGSVSLDQFFQAVPAGAAITGVTSTNDNVIDDTVISEDGKEITYTSKANLTTEDAKDTYTVTIETKNYNDIEATLIFTTIAKTPVNISGVSVTGAGKTYDGRAVSYAGTPVAKTNDGTEVTVTGTYSYVWQTADGTALSAAPKDAGSYKLVITLNDTAYLGSAEVSFTISKAQVTITANDAEAYTGSDMPKLSYTVTGLASGESLAVEPTLSCAADMRKAGSYEIEVSGAAVPDTGNYVEAITYVSGVLTVKDRPINIGPVYDITVLESAHGTVKASLGNASEGSTIRLTVTPDEGYSLYSITVRAENGKLIDVSKSGGVYSFKMPASAVTVQASFVKGTAKLPFNDVSENNWFYDAVMYAYSNGIMNGLDTNVFGPNETTTRAMLVTMLYRAAGEPAVRGTNTFRDVAANTWYTDAIIWASTNGIVTGVDDGLFNPNGAITREQLATILYRYAKYVGDDVSASASLAGFTDAGSISDYAKDAMSWAVAAGLFEGRDNGKLEPTGTATRAEIATVFMRHFG